MHTYRITFIGGGRMASALLAGLMDSDVPPSTLHVIDPSEEVQQRLSQQWGITVAALYDANTPQADVLVLAVKPQMMAAALATVAPHLPKLDQPLIISVASGISMASLATVLGQRPMIRTMPNTPATVGAGMTAMVSNERARDTHRRWAEDLMGRVGQWVWLDEESNLDLVTAVSGSGPAYFFALAEEMIHAAVTRGLSPEIARTLVHQTAYGAGQLLVHPEAVASALRQGVTSPGGTTEAALEVFDRYKFHSLVDEAIEAALQRSKVLSHALSDSNPKENQ
jgi:pyrroline-5-carboxylate reductase